MPRNPRDYDKERKYNGTPEQKKNNAARKRARRAYEKANGPIPAGHDIDHKRMLTKGGSATKLSNLRAVPVSKNRSFPRTKTGAAK